MPKKARKDQQSQAHKNRLEGYSTVVRHPLFARLGDYVRWYASDNSQFAGWAVVHSNGTIYVHPRRLGKPEEWAFVFAHCMLHLAFSHHHKFVDKPREWNIACCCFVNRLVKDLQIGKPPGDICTAVDLPGKTEEKMYEFLCRDARMVETVVGTAGGAADMYGSEKAQYYSVLATGVHNPGSWRNVEWESAFAEGLADAAASAVNVAAGLEPFLGARTSQHLLSNAEKARRWFVNCYPLLGALAASFKLLEDPLICRGYQVSVAAINAELQEIYVNPAASLSEEEAKFVMAHEFLHVGLRHHLRCQGRDEYLWNVACDYVINHWLIEMGVGGPPPGALLDESLKGMSAEAVYDLIVKDLRRYRKLATLRGNCADLGDIIKTKHPSWWDALEGMALDDFYRRALAEGLSFHEATGRGLLPAGLVEEIRALSQPPIPWDVELAQWFDHYFPPVEKNRSYARPSRRQSTTPDIPRPRYVEAMPGEARTFAVVLDTSGSMDRGVLAKALGAIASYSMARDVPLCRVVFCDAAPYDQGYLSPDVIADRMEVKGRGGTVLQPGIDLIEQARDFPPQGPILIITDALCDHVIVKRNHAFLIPTGAYLPFKPIGPVFRIK